MFHYFIILKTQLCFVAKRLTAFPHWSLLWCSTKINPFCVTFHAADDNDNPFAENTSEVLSVVLTNFHVLLLYSDRLKVICSLNEQLIFEDVYTSR